MSGQTNTLSTASGQGTPGGGRIVKCGDKVAISLVGSALNWDCSGGHVALTDKSNKQVEILWANAGGASPTPGQALTNGCYLRLASAVNSGPNRFLQAYQGGDHGGDPNRVMIGAFAAPSEYSIFYVRKVSGAPGSVIERGDEVQIRGTYHDPWLAVGSTPAAGDAVGLVHHPESDDPQSDVAHWTFGNNDGSD